MKLTNLIPMLEVKDINETKEYYTTILGFNCEGIFPNEESPTWMSLSKDAVELMFCTRNCHTTSEKPIMTGSLYLYPENIDEVWTAIKDKVEIEYPIEDFDYCMREFAIRDCNGYIIQFG